MTSLLIVIIITFTYLPYRASGSTLTAVGRSHSVAGPMAWNSLPDFIRDPTSSTDCVRRLLKKYLFARYYSASCALGVLNDYALYKSTHSLTRSLSIRNLFLSVLYIALSSEIVFIVFWFCCFVLYVILTLLFVFVV